MSKSNVNPNHYKVAGRERQGEDIPQARNKQKHAESLVRRRAERGAAAQQAAAAPKAPVAGGALPAKVAPAKPERVARPAPRKTRANPLKSPPGQKRGQSLVPGRPAPHARFAKSKSVPVLGQMGAVPTRTVAQATKKARKPATRSKAMSRR